MSFLFCLTEEDLEEDDEETGGDEGGSAEEGQGQQGRHPLPPSLARTLNHSLQSHHILTSLLGEGGGVFSCVNC